MLRLLIFGQGIPIGGDGLAFGFLAGFLLLLLPLLLAFGLFFLLLLTAGFFGGPVLAFAFLTGKKAGGWAIVILDSSTQPAGAILNGCDGKREIEVIDFLLDEVGWMGGDELGGQLAAQAAAGEFADEGRWRGGEGSFQR